MLDIGWECISPKNITLEVFIAIYFWSREGGGPSTEESNIVNHQEKRMANPCLRWRTHSESSLPMFLAR